MNKDRVEQYSYWAKREVKTYAVLYNGAKSLLEVGKEIERGSLYQVMASLIFSAFTIEGWLNHLGKKKIKYWEEIEKRVSVKSKLMILCDHLKIKHDPSKRPIQTITKLFHFRDFMAHARTETLEKEGLLKANPRLRKTLIETDWEKYCTTENAERSLTDVRKIIEELGEAAGEKYPVAWLGSEEHVISPAT